MAEQGERVMRAFWAEARKHDGSGLPFDDVPTGERETLVRCMTVALASSPTAADLDKDSEIARLREALEEAASTFNGIYHYTFEAGSYTVVRDEAANGERVARAALTKGKDR